MRRFEVLSVLVRLLAHLRQWLRLSTHWESVARTPAHRQIGASKRAGCGPSSPVLRGDLAHPTRPGSVVLLEVLAVAEGIV